MTGRELKDLVDEIPDDAIVAVSDGYGDPDIEVKLFEPGEIHRDFNFWILSGAGDEV